MKQALVTILKAGETAASVLDKFKKMNTNATPESKTAVVNINQCVDEAVELMAHEFKKKNVSIQRLQWEPSSIGASYHSLTQVFINLFTNASHAMATEGGKIDIAVNKAVVDQVEWVEIRIRDHGPGVPPNILPQVMNPFFTTKGQQGTGLGLAICKEIIESEHLGDFTVSNHAEGGLEVLIRLPERRGVK